MANKKVLVLPGDGAGPDVIAAAERIIETAAPGIDTIHGEIGFSAYESSYDALPPETEDMIAASNAVLCGHVNKGGTGGKDPVLAILRHTNMYAEVSEFYPLGGNIGSKDLDITVIGPNTAVNQQISELESLEGVETSTFTSSYDIEKFLRKTVSLCGTKKKTKVTVVAENDLLPVTAGVFRTFFGKVFAGTGFRTEVMDGIDAADVLAEHPEELQILLTGPFSGPFIRGEASGMSGGRGLMPVAYVGDDISLHMPDACGARTDGRISNPTSAILAAAFMLLNLGYEKARDDIVAAVRGMYRSGETTRDAGGRKTPKEFTDGIIELLRSQ